MLLFFDSLAAANAIYAQMYPGERPDSVVASFQVIYLIAWKPDKTQQQAKRRGSAQMSLKDIDKFLEAENIKVLTPDGEDATKK